MGKKEEQSGGVLVFPDYEASEQAASSSAVVDSTFADVASEAVADPEGAVAVEGTLSEPCTTHTVLFVEART